MVPPPRALASNSIPEQALDARKAAVEEVERLLQHPEDLKRLPALIDEYTQKHQANKAQLSETVGTQVDAARTGTDLLDAAQRSLSKMRESYKVIDMLCTETSSLIEQQGKIQVLAGVHYKVGKTLQDVEKHHGPACRGRRRRGDAARRQPAPAGVRDVDHPGGDQQHGTTGPPGQCPPQTRGHLQPQRLLQ
eukprot:jgi/Botrbrau1/2704/Bobra.0203s0046.1